VRLGGFGDAIMAVSQRRTLLLRARPERSAGPTTHSRSEILLACFAREILWLQQIWSNTYTNDAAGLNDIQAQALGFFDYSVRFSSGVEPKLITSLTGNLR
jgi:hypothetical protein